MDYDMDYPMYSSLAELCDSASLVMTGTPVASEVRNVNILAEDQGDTPEENPALGTGQTPDGASIVETVVTFKVGQVSAGRKAAAGDLVEVGQPGGLYEGVHYLADQVALREGARYLLFLDEFDGAPAGLLNPSQAVYEVAADGTVSSSSTSLLAKELVGLDAGPGVCG